MTSTQLNQLLDVIIWTVNNIREKGAEHIDECGRAQMRQALNHLNDTLTHIIFQICTSRPEDKPPTPNPTIDYIGPSEGGWAQKFQFGSEKRVYYLRDGEWIDFCFQPISTEALKRIGIR